MYSLLDALGWYNPIKSVELGEAIPAQVAVTVLSEETEVGLAVSVGPLPPNIINTPLVQDATYTVVGLVSAIATL